MYAKSNRVVQVNPLNEVVLSADDQGATTFMLVKCRAWDTVSEALRPRCFSLVDTNRPGWYVRHRGFFLYVDPEPESDLQLFDLASSFILHSDKFYPGYYALESVDYPNYYIQSSVYGRLRITLQSDTAVYHDTASFTMSGYSTIGEWFLLVCLIRGVDLLMPLCFESTVQWE